MSRALVLATNGTVRLEDRAVPNLVDGEVRVQVIATGICGSDVHGAAGDTGRRVSGQVMGHETVGRVIDVGAEEDAGLLGVIAAIDPVVSCGECARCRHGEHQHCETGWVLGVRPDKDGAFATEVVVPNRNVVPLPESMTPWHGALIEPLAVGYHAAIRGSVSESDRVLVLGGGPIGQAVALACARLGARRVVVSEPRENRGTLLESLGFVHSTPDELEGAVHREFGAGATVVFDVVGTDGTLATAITHSTALARIVLVGMDSPRICLDAYAVSAGERALIGTICSTREHFRDTAVWAAQNPGILDRLVDRRERLEYGARVFAELLAGTANANKVLLFTDSDSLGVQ